MRLSWSRWSIATKILIPFLGLSIVTMAIIAYVAISNIRTLGEHALETSTTLGQNAISQSTQALTKLGEDMIEQTAKDVAQQVELYLTGRPPMSLATMRADAALRHIAVQPVGTTGYTTLLDPANSRIVIHKYLEQEKDISHLKDVLPSFWKMLQSSSAGPVSGYYAWQEVDGSITQKYASIVPIKGNNGMTLTLWATTYIEEFSQPALTTKDEINVAIAASSDYINKNMNDTRDAFIIVFTALIIIVVGLSLLIAWFITHPILALKAGAEAITKGNLDYALNIKNQDELGELAVTFNRMARALRFSRDELQRSAAERIAKEREIQDNLRLYAQKVSQAQEAERKRIARELHDETVQELIVIARQLDDLNAGRQSVSPEEMRKEVRKVIDGVRQYSHELRPPILDDLGLVPAVQSLCAELSKNYGIQVEVEVKGTPFQLKAERELLLFRIIQESLTNVRRHSRAASAHVAFIFEDNNIRLIVHDDGMGFRVPSTYESLTGKGQLGLVGMRERVQLLGGTLVIDSKPGQGTTLRIEVPAS